MKAEFDGKQYEVQFTGQWHNPPLDGAINPQRIKHTMRCELRPATPIGVGADVVAVSGEAHCSVADRFNYMGGCRRALDRAVGDLLHLYDGPLLDEAQAKFERQVMPALAKEQEERRAAMPKAQQKRRRRPGRHLLQTTVDDLIERAGLAITSLREGADFAVLHHTSHRVRAQMAQQAGEERRAAKMAAGAKR